MTRFAMLTAAFAAALLAASACDSEDTKTYDVTITWNIAGAETCTFHLDEDTVLEFDKVQVDVFEEEGDTDPIQDPIQADCGDFSLVVPRLSRGTYFVELGAWAEDDDGDYLPYFQASGEIRAPAESDQGYDFGLVLGSGEIEIKWGFANYEWCDSNGVVDLDISLVDETVACDDETYLLEDVTPGSYTLTITGLDDAGDPVVEGAYNDGQPFSVKPGQTIEALVILDEI
jgi:hypothetical protein